MCNLRLNLLDFCFAPRNDSVRKDLEITEKACCAHVAYSHLPIFKKPLGTE